jgi:hypothetical protein
MLSGGRVSQFTPHAALAPSSERWLVHLADPARRVPAPPSLPDPVQVETMLAAAESHGVLPAVIRGLGALSQAGGGRDGAGGALAAPLEAARLRLAYQTGFGLLLSHHATRAMQALHDAGITATIVKGAAVARRLYPDVSLRTFTDVDVLLPEAQRDAPAGIMRGLGFGWPARGPAGRYEQKWVLAAQRDVMIELHSNLVHSPKLRGAMCVRHEDVLDAGGGDSNAPTALLLVAAAHAAVGHQCDRLQHLVDVTQAARGAAGPIDRARLAAVSRRCGVTLAVAAALDLAGRTFREPAATDLARMLMPGQTGRLAGMILSPRLVLRAQSQARSHGSWRRKVFRQALRLGVA